MRIIILIMVLLLLPAAFAQIELHERSHELSDMLSGLDTSALGQRQAHVYIDDVFAGCVTTGSSTQVILEECGAPFDAFFSETAVDVIIGSEDPIATFKELKKSKDITLHARGMGNKLRLTGLNLGITIGSWFGLF